MSKNELIGPKDLTLSPKLHEKAQQIAAAKGFHTPEEAVAHAIVSTHAGLTAPEDGAPASGSSSSPASGSASSSPSGK